MKRDRNGGGERDGKGKESWVISIVGIHLMQFFTMVECRQLLPPHAHQTKQHCDSYTLQWPWNDFKPDTRQTWQSWRELLCPRAWIETWLSLPLLVSPRVCLFSSVLASFWWLDTKWSCFRKCLRQIDLCASLLGILMVNCWHGRAAPPLPLWEVLYPVWWT